MNQTNLTTLGMGCFWCSEAIYQSLTGIHKITSGFTGGHVENPSYEEVCQGTTGHAEVIQIEFDPEKISYETILSVFWKLHNPTLLNRQDYDVGTAYRSIILYHSLEQKATAIQSRDQVQKLFENPIVTEIVPMTDFYPAEKHHQNFYQKNADSSYCKIIIDPKIEKLKKFQIAPKNQT